MKIITAVEASKAYMKSHTERQLCKLDCAIRSVMEQQESITLYSSKNTDEHLKERAPKVFKKIMETRELLYPEFEEVTPETKQTLEKAGFELFEDEHDVINERNFVVASYVSMEISWRREEMESTL